MKKIITVTLCIVLVLLFAGCGKNGDTSKVKIDYGTLVKKKQIELKYNQSNPINL